MICPAGHPSAFKRCPACAAEVRRAAKVHARKNPQPRTSAPPEKDAPRFDEQEIRIAAARTTFRLQLKARGRLPAYSGRLSGQITTHHKPGGNPA